MFDSESIGLDSLSLPRGIQRRQPKSERRGPGVEVSPVTRTASARLARLCLFNGPVNGKALPVQQDVLGLEVSVADLLTVCVLACPTPSKLAASGPLGVVAHGAV
jgi:hypothetical protein